jgi:hypothetical protein
MGNASYVRRMAEMYRAIADDLDRHADSFVSSEPNDKLDAYREILSALQSAEEVLHETADWQGLPRKREARCRHAGNKCARAREQLQKLTELS